MATYNISSLDELQDINDGHLADDCVLLNDIDASATRAWNQGTGVGYLDQYYGFIPIGAPSSSFTGTFDGGGHKITNLYINRTHSNDADYPDKVGLFSDVARNVAAGFIKDLTLENVDITGGTMVGGLAGEMQAGTAGYMSVENVHVTGIIRGTYQYLGSGTNEGVGGMSGVSIKAKYTDCSTTVQMPQTVDRTGGEAFGGFDGLGVTTTYIDCSSSGSVTCEFTTTSAVYVGGFTGQTSTGPSYSGCVSSVAISVNITGSIENRIGGFFGIGGGTADKCFAYGDCESLSSVPAYVGGFDGIDGSGSTYTKCGSEGNVENYSEHATINHSGGFIGKHLTASITNCYAKGTVNLQSGIGHENARIGGFCGAQQDSGSCTFVNCYSVGEVYSTGAPTNGGGFLGLDTSGAQTNCFWDTETSGWSTSDGDATGKTTLQMHTESTFTDASWNFTDVWYLPSFTRSPGIATSIWLSQSGDYDNFDEGTADDDSFRVAVQTTNLILWVEALEALLVGTAGDEFKIGSNKLDTPLSPTNFGVKQQSTYGSANIQPVKVNEVILFIDFVKRKVREMTFRGDMEKYVSPDLTSLAEHITVTGIVNIAHQKNPDSILWCVLTDGSLIAMVYDREQEVVAWYDCPIDGVVQSVCVTPGTDEDEVWISVKRTINSSDVVYIEKMASRTQGDIEDSFYVDSGITSSTGTVYYESEVVAYDSETVYYEPDSEITEINGFNHLIGEKAAILADGEIIYDGTEDGSVVDANGNVTLPAAASYSMIQGGLPYTAVLQPERIVQSDRNGTSMGAKTRVNELKLVFLNSLGVQYGPDEDNLYDIDFDDIRWEDAGYITGLFSGDIRVSMPGGFSVNNPILVSSSDPLPCTLKAIIASLDVTGR